MEEEEEVEEESNKQEENEWNDGMLVGIVERLFI